MRGRIVLLLWGDEGEAGQDPSGVEIVDIKTSESRPPLAQHRNQLRLFAEAARTLGLNPVRLAIHDLDSEDGAAIPVEDDRRELARFQEDMRRWIHGIRSASFVARSGQACGGCDYVRVC
ncbi:MAG: PD-(D/E)XK nuclease family protein [Firmicutes bacterium]|nr:PD-(D/E)XK nuclease family protein [Bacillota bacterium]MDH7496247.1 PD-(D/E)XK nuclease family protein [Bacillota bacterium]